MKRLTEWLAAPLFWLTIVLCMLLGSLPAHAQTAPTFTFGVSGTSTDGKTIVPTVTWSTTPAATSCAATATPAKTDWTGNKAAAGTAALTAVAATTSFQLLCNWPGNTTAIVTWAPPTTNTDGSPLTDLAGFRVQWGQQSGDQNMDQTVYLSNPALRTWTSPALSPTGQWFFGVKAFNSLGLESALSNIASKVTTATTALTRSMDIVIRFPAAPTNLTVQ